MRWKEKVLVSCMEGLRELKRSLSAAGGETSAASLMSRLTGHA